MSAPKPPPYLRPDTRKWFQTVARDFDFEPHHFRLLTSAGEAWDRCQEARERLAKDGAYVEDRFGQLKAHPAVAVERDSRIAFARLLRELALDVDAPGENRPPAIAR
jgi:phage terminase small subunit